MNQKHFLDKVRKYGYYRCDRNVVHEPKLGVGRPRGFGGRPCQGDPHHTCKFTLHSMPKYTHHRVSRF